MRTFEFDVDEIEVLREALSEYKHFIKPKEQSSKLRLQLYDTASLLLDKLSSSVRIQERE